jgi:integrase
VTRDERLQLSITGKGGKVRQVLLPEVVSRSLLSLRGDAGANDPVFRSRKGGSLSERAINGMVKRTAAKAGINEAISPHWLRHAHGSHAIDHGRFAARGSDHTGPRQHRHHIRLSACASRQLERPKTRSGSVSSMKISAILPRLG